MSNEAYEEGRLHRENMSEEIARAFHAATQKIGPRHGLPLIYEWEDLTENTRASIQEAFLDLIDHGVISPFSVVKQLQIELTEIKQTWGKLNDMLGGR